MTNKEWRHRRKMMTECVSVWIFKSKGWALYHWMEEDVQSSYAMALNNLGATYLACKEHALAKQMLERCIIEKENLFGKANPALVSTLHSLSQVLEALGDDRAAKEAQERVAHINEATLKAQQV